MGFKRIIIDLFYLKIMENSGFYSNVWSQNVVVIDCNGSFFPRKSFIIDYYHTKPQCGQGKILQR